MVQISALTVLLMTLIACGQNEKAEEQLKYNIGHDTLASVRYADALIEALPSHAPVSMLLNYFDTEKYDSFSELNKLANHFETIKIIGMWNDEHFYSSEEQRSKLADIVDEVYFLTLNYPNVRWQFSPFLEHRLGRITVSEYMQYLLTQLPHVEIINNPIGMGHYSLDPKVTNELHHFDTPFEKVPDFYQFSFDGLDLPLTRLEELRELIEKSDIVWWWIPEYNLSESLQRVPVEERTVVVTAELIREQDRIIKEEFHARKIRKIKSQYR
jgi:hypothetical protein